MSELATIARPYANAAFRAGKETSNGLPGWSRMLSFLAAAVAEETVEELLGQPMVTGEEKLRRLREVCGEEINEVGGNFLEVLAENGRLSLLPEIAHQFERLKADDEAVMDVQIRSAFALSDDEKERFVKALEKRFGKRVVVEVDEDRSLVGGLIIKAGDTVIDGTVRARLEKLGQQLRHA